MKLGVNPIMQMLTLFSEMFRKEVNIICAEEYTKCYYTL
jgi:hypothetical protein